MITNPLYVRYHVLYWLIVLRNFEYGQGVCAGHKIRSTLSFLVAMYRPPNASLIYPNMVVCEESLFIIRIVSDESLC